jgi:hypothetical protein
VDKRCKTRAAAMQEILQIKMELSALDRKFLASPLTRAPRASSEK